MAALAREAAPVQIPAPNSFDSSSICTPLAVADESVSDEVDKGHEAWRHDSLSTEHGAAVARKSGCVPRPSQISEFPGTSSQIVSFSDLEIPGHRRQTRALTEADMPPASAVTAATPVSHSTSQADCQALTSQVDSVTEVKQEPHVPVLCPQRAREELRQPVTHDLGTFAGSVVGTASAASAGKQPALSCTRCGATFGRPCELGNHLKSCRTFAQSGSNFVASPKRNPSSFKILSQRASSNLSANSRHSLGLRSSAPRPRTRIPNPKYAEDFETSLNSGGGVRSRAAETSGSKHGRAAAIKRKREPQRRPVVKAPSRPWQPLAGTDVVVKKKKKGGNIAWRGPRKRPRKINRQPRWQCVNCLTRCSHDATECPTCHELKDTSLEDVCKLEEEPGIDLARLTQHRTVVAYDERMLLHVKDGSRDEVSVGECFAQAGVVSASEKTTTPHASSVADQSDTAATMVPGSDGPGQQASQSVAFSSAACTVESSTATDLRRVLDNGRESRARSNNEPPSVATGRPPDSSWMNGTNLLNITDTNSRRDNRKVHPHPERPERIRCMMEYFDTLGLMTNVQRLTGREATEKELRAVHTKRHIDCIFNNNDESCDDDMEGCIDTPLAARVAAGTTIETVLSVATGRADNAVAIVRPPGHHAEADSAMGFCCFNNVAIAVRAAQQAKCGVERVLVVDWDVHHGNGTQDIFYDDPSVLTFSIHRRDKLFYPPSGFPEETGKDIGAGFSVNVGWSQKGMGDADYLLAFSRILLPLAYQFNPDLVIISAGFDASAGDPLGGCDVSPAGFAHLTALLQGASRGKLVLVQEGGYNLKQITRCFAACLRVLRGEAPPPLEDRYPKDVAYDDIRKTEQALATFWMGFGYAGINPQQVEGQATAGQILGGETDCTTGKHDKAAAKQPREETRHTKFQPPKPLPKYPPPKIPSGKVDMLVGGRLPKIGNTHHVRAPAWCVARYAHRACLIGYYRRYF